MEGLEDTYYGGQTTAWAALLLALAAGIGFAALSSWSARGVGDGSKSTTPTGQSVVSRTLREGFAHGFPFVSVRHRGGGMGAQMTRTAIRAGVQQGAFRPAAHTPAAAQQQGAGAEPQLRQQQQQQASPQPQQQAPLDPKEQADELAALLHQFFQSNTRLADWVAKGGLASLGKLMPAVCGPAAENADHHMLLLQVSWLVLQVVHSSFVTRSKLQEHIPAPLVGSLMTAALQARRMPHGMQAAVLRNCCWTLSSICNVSWILHDASRAAQAGAAPAGASGSMQPAATGQQEEQRQLLAMGVAYGRDIVSSGMLTTLQSLKADFGVDTANFTAALLASLSLLEQVEPLVASSAQQSLLQPGTAALLCQLLASNRHGGVNTLLCHYLHHMLLQHLPELVWQLVLDRAVQDLLTAVPQQLAQLAAYQLLSPLGQETMVAYEAQYCVDVPVALAHLLMSDQANKLVRVAMRDSDDADAEDAPITKTVSLRAVACRMLLSGERLEELVNAAFDELAEAEAGPAEPSEWQQTFNAPEAKVGPAGAMQPQPWVTDTVAALTQLMSHLQLLDIQLCEYRANYGAGLEDRSSLMTSIRTVSERSKFSYCQLQFADAASERSNRRLRLGVAASERSSIGQRSSITLPTPLQQQQQRARSCCQTANFPAPCISLPEPLAEEQEHDAAQHEHHMAAVGPRSSKTLPDSACTAGSTPTGHLASPTQHSKHDTAQSHQEVPWQRQSADGAADLGYLTIVALASQEGTGRLHVRAMSAAHPFPGHLFDPNLSRPLSSLDNWTGHSTERAVDAAQSPATGTQQHGKRDGCSWPAGETVSQSITSPTPGEIRGAAAGSKAVGSSARCQAQRSDSGDRVVLAYGLHEVTLTASEYAAVRKLSGLLRQWTSGRPASDAHKVLRVPSFTDEQNCTAVRALVAAAAQQAAPGPAPVMPAACSAAAASAAAAGTQQGVAASTSSTAGLVAAEDALVVWQAADFYQVDKLKEYCEDLLVLTLRQNMIPSKASVAPSNAAQQGLQHASTSVDGVGVGLLDSQRCADPKQYVASRGPSASGRVSADGHVQLPAVRSDVGGAAAGCRQQQGACAESSTELSAPLRGKHNGCQPSCRPAPHAHCIGGSGTAAAGVPSVAVQYIQEPNGDSQLHAISTPSSLTGPASTHALPGPRQAADNASDTAASPSNAGPAAVLDLLTDIFGLIAHYQHSSARLQHLVSAWLLSDMKQLVSCKALAALLACHKAACVLQGAGSPACMPQS